MTVNEPVVRNNTKQYTIDIDTFLEIDPSLVGQNLTCNEVLLFIFENQTTIEQFGNYVDLLKCNFDAINSTNETFTSRLTISEIQEPLLNAFLQQLIFISIDLSNIILECSGFTDFLVTSDGLNCTLPTQEDFCTIRDEAIVSGQNSNGGLGIPEEPSKIPNEQCVVGQNVSVIQRSENNS